MCEEDEDLVRYHFDEMPADERRAFEGRLDGDPELRDRLDQFRRCVEGGDGDGDHEEAAPDGLADRTAESCFESLTSTPCGDKSRLSLTETTVVALVVLTIGALVTPALLASRSSSQRLACQEQMHRIGRALILYSHAHDDYFPRIGPGANAGMFTVALVESGAIDRDELTAALVCPASELSSQVALQSARVYVPTEEELRTARRSLLERWRRGMAGSYAYRLGHYERGVYTMVLNRDDSRSPLLSDAPGAGCASFSSNHGPCGQNVLFQDGHVRFQTDCWLPGMDDHLFLNHEDRVAAGRDWRDAVLARSEASPGVPRRPVVRPAAVGR